ncbi:type II secretion system protein GspL [Pseudomonas sp. TTU2014-080ASC]|uniref:type II secretion system protein GspL n=1 Tax=Pseudomonas sp. TTU2014-080ASC TaxID=1729724 RepID=UPI00071888E4|nr:type II secretion system protein GspL [Pseudomonas sp. TTU2014-080ASC]KRW59392.1 hypothetical protein AO726_11265 [Pseudomonas sp. TTU2014-080ASC]
MSHWLYLLPDAQSPYCYWWHADGPLQQGTLAQAGEQLSGHRPGLILPMEMASYHHVSVPARSGRWLRQALSNAVEEQVIEELENLHLAHGPLRDKSHCAVAAINRDALKRCLAQLAEVNLQPLCAYLDADCLPVDQPRALLLVNRWLLGGHTPVRMALADAELAGFQALLPADLYWQGEHAPSLPGEQNINWQLEERPWALLSQGAAQAINLLQGEFRQQAPQPPAWRGVAVALAIAAGAAVLQNLFLSTYLNQQSDQIQAESDALWRQRFPAAGPLDDLAGYIRTHQQNDAPHYKGVALRLSDLAHLWSSSHGALAQVQRLDYQVEDGWSLQVSAAAFSDLQQLREGLIAQGLDASTDSSVRDIQGVSARFQIRE